MSLRLCVVLLLGLAGSAAALVPTTTPTTTEPHVFEDDGIPTTPTTTAAPRLVQKQQRKQRRQQDVEEERDLEESGSSKKKAFKWKSRDRGDDERLEASSAEEPEDEYSLETIPGRVPILSKDEVFRVHVAIDSDKDRKISESEFAAFAKEMRKQINRKEDVFEYMITMEIDKDRDGILRLKDVLWPPTSSMNADDIRWNKEFNELEEHKFKAADRNHDGILEKEEVRYFFHPENHDEVITARANKFLQLRDFDGSGDLTYREWLADRGDHELHDKTIPFGSSDREEFYWLDEDKTGTLSLEELKIFEVGAHRDIAVRRKLFDNADYDRDELISVKELEKHYDAGMDHEIESKWSHWKETMEL